MTERLIDHVRVDIGVGLETATISGIAQTISLLLHVLTLFGSLLTNLFDLLDFVFPLEVSFFNLLDSIFILLLQSL